MQKPCPAAIAAITAAIVVLIIMLCIIAWTARGSGSCDPFWTQYGGAIPPDEQARRFDAAEKGVPDMPWAEANWPPNICGAVPPPVRGEPRRLGSPFWAP